MWVPFATILKKLMLKLPLQDGLTHFLGDLLPVFGCGISILSQGVSDL
jgi:hypothetical protein